jgi:hypothetical protein
MKRLTILILATALAVSLAGIAAADTATPRVHRRIVRQEMRIHRGVRSGQLTRREAWRAQRGERHIRREAWRAKADGRVTPRERARLNRSLDRQSARIWRLKHNRRTIGVNFLVVPTGGTEVASAA